MNEAAARIKINTLLETAGWRFFFTSDQSANICLEAKVALHTNDLERLGNNFENAKRGFIDSFLPNKEIARQRRLTYKIMTFSTTYYLNKDAKQFLGLNDCQARCSASLNFHFNEIL